jgi:hypothetical protein
MLRVQATGKEVGAVYMPGAQTGGLTTHAERQQYPSPPSAAPSCRRDHGVHVAWKVMVNHM